MPPDSLPLQEQKRRISVLLHKVDEEIKKRNYDNALDTIRRVYQLDIKNIYARAYEERILVLKLEQERGELKREAEQKAAQEVETRVKQWVDDFQTQKAREEKSKKVQEIVGTELESRAREAALEEMTQRMQEVERRLTEQMQAALEAERRKAESGPKQHVGEIKLSIESGGDMLLLKKEYEAKLQLAREGIEREMRERLGQEQSTIQQETFAKLGEEHRKNQEELLRQFDEERQTIVQREETKAKGTALSTLETIFFLMMQLKIELDAQDAILQTIRMSFGISEEEYTVARRNSHLHSFVNAVRSTWEKGKPTPDEMELLANLKQTYQISDEENLNVVNKVKKELGLPDETAVILVIDDDPAILRFIEHTLNRTYQTVLTATGVNEALNLIEHTMPALILSDVQMPVMGGLTFFTKIQNGEYGNRLKSVPFLMMSALTDEFFIDSTKNLGIKSYLTKPFTREVLEETVRQAFD